MKRARVVATVGWHSLPTVLSTTIWSFIHILECSLLLPNKEQHRASQKAQWRLTEFHLDERWLVELNRPRTHVHQHRLAQLILSRFSAVQRATFRFDDMHGSNQTFFRPICEHFSSVRSLGVWFNDQEFEQNAKTLISGRNLEKIDCFPMVVRDASSHVLSAVRSPSLTHLGTNASPSNVLRWLDVPRVLAPIESLSNFVYDIQDAVAPLLRNAPALRDLDTDFARRCSNVYDLAVYGQILKQEVPQLQRLALAFHQTEPYAPVASLSCFLGLRRLKVFQIFLRGVKWERSKQVQYDHFAVSALASWPDIEEIDTTMPVTDAFWTMPMTGGQHLRSFSAYQYDVEAARKWAAARNPTCSVKGIPNA